MLPEPLTAARLPGILSRCNVTHICSRAGDRDLASKPTSDSDYLVTLGNSASLRAQWG